MGVPTSVVGYTPAMPRREDHEVHKGHVVALGGGGTWTWMWAILSVTKLDLGFLFKWNPIYEQIHSPAVGAGSLKMNVKQTGIKLSDTLTEVFSTLTEVFPCFFPRL